jgi:DNA-directed RNA polymerase specialized sigma24 family protein
VRRADAQLQIEKILTLKKPQIIEMISGNKKRDEADYLLDESIVYLLREAKIDNDSSMIETLYTELNRRIWKLLAKFRANFKNNQADYEDFGQQAGLAVVKKILDTGSNSADYAQVNFGDFVISEAKSVWKQNLVRVKREEEMFNSGREGEEDENKLENISLEHELSAESRLIFEEGLRKLLPEHQTVAAMLLDGFQIESKDPNELTISKHLGVSSRTIRNWIKEMRRVLAGYQGEAV